MLHNMKYIVLFIPKLFILEGVSNQNFLGSIIHPAGNIAELMLREGFARCVDWSMGVLSSGHDKYRQAEKFAKQKQLRIWKGYAPSTTNLPIKDSEFSGKVFGTMPPSFIHSF